MEGGDVFTECKVDGYWRHLACKDINGGGVDPVESHSMSKFWRDIQAHSRRSVEAAHGACWKSGVKRKRGRNKEEPGSLGFAARFEWWM